MKLKRNWQEIGLWVLGKRWRFQISNVSMLPTLKPQDNVLVVPVSAASPLLVGDIIIFFHPLQPRLRLIKRISETFYDGSCYVLSDNAAEGSDSRTFGVVGRELIIGKVTSRLI